MKPFPPFLFLRMWLANGKGVECVKERLVLGARSRARLSTSTEGPCRDSRRKRTTLISHLRTGGARRPSRKTPTKDLDPKAKAGPLIPFVTIIFPLSPHLFASSQPPLSLWGHTYAKTESDLHIDSVALCSTPCLTQQAPTHGGLQDVHTLPLDECFWL